MVNVGLRKESTRNFKIIIIIAICSLRCVVSYAEPQRFSQKEAAFETVDYKLTLKVDYEKAKIHGNCRLTVSNSSGQPYSSIPLILYPLLEVNSVTDAEGKALSFSQQVLPFEDEEKMKVNYIDVTTRSPIRAGEKTTVCIQYEGQLSGYVDAGHSYVKDHVSKEFTIIRLDCFAYPQIGYPSFTAVYKTIMKSFRKGFGYLIEITVPEDMVVANGGKLIGKSCERGQVTYRYENIKPAWRMDVCIAKYRTLEDKKNKLQVFYFEGGQENAKRVLTAMGQAMELFSNWFGALKNYEGFAVIELQEGYGGQTDVTSILLEKESFGNKLDQVYHEASHLWNPKSPEVLPCRLDEGLANFLQYLAAEKLENRKDALKMGLEEKRGDFQRQYKGNPKYKNVPIADYGKENLTGASYSKGMIAFYVLYRLAGEENFIQMERQFYQKYGENGATLEDFVKTSKELSRTDLTKFFEEWIYDVKSSEYLLSNMPIEDIIANYKTAK